MVAMAIVFLMVIFNLGITDAQFCYTNCGNGYCCPASHPMCVQGLPKCCPRGTIVYIGGLCYIRLGKSAGKQSTLNATDAAHTMI
ncbi:unnamed protein product [Rotaria sp. Silwood1]|nr:unnamed protein product [Rotaria sp. Silwood1]CAF1635974.1 unnamed protein product [Rotaria sp. Silwood1]CAF3827028.1 unnamed protein product [Rotaria sp. Silwood1]CAF3837370.1 unnamed protein product [Rotaria sp. Silwood1]CAF3894092.1 unnamed protein product [Rotaria sp. Silwood1]